MADTSMARRMCPKGHEYTVENTMWNGSRRECLKCRHARHERRSRLRGHVKREPVLMPTDPAVLAYAAGIVDGEGALTIAKRKKHGTDRYYHHFFVRVTSADQCLTDWLRDHFGGYVGVTPPREGQVQDVHRWAVTSRRAGPFLRAIRPYLVIKGDRADLVLALADTKVRDGTGRKAYVTAELFEHRESLRQRLLALNRRERA